MILAMVSLRRLDVEGCRRLKKLPNGIGTQKDVVVPLDRFPVVATSRDAGGEEEVVVAEEEDAAATATSEGWEV